MFNAFFGYFTSTSAANTDADNAPRDAPTAEELEQQQVERDALREEEYVFVEQPTVDNGEMVIVESMDITAFDDNDDIVALAEAASKRSKTSSTVSEAVKKREALNLAKAKNAGIRHLESMMFTDPISGKDVRHSKNSRNNGHSASSNTVVRRVNGLSGSQRSKMSSGKSCDRKVHRSFDLTDI
uniref:Uncharacterized protein n=3 Tax=Caenorhabditis japonica TaxID=281687 RepID=A0A8R1DNT0_CAEJA